MRIEIDPYSGFCFGVQNAIDKAESMLNEGQSLNCLGDIVHNQQEVGRLTQLGMHTTLKEEIETIENKTILIRSHGEPPSTYSSLKQNKNKIIDATCPVVLKLQSRIKKSFEDVSFKNGQLVIFGKKGHPEVIGLNGQTNNQSIVVSTIADLIQIDFSRPIELYCQTTMPLDTFQEIKNAIEKRAEHEVLIHDTICRQVANRVPRMKEFSEKHDLILFVSGKKSSNGKLLFDVCEKTNAKSFFISSAEEIENEWFSGIKSIGICGATSTPQWLMENVKRHVKTILNLS